MMTKKKQIAWVLVMALFTACSSTPKQTETETVAPQWPYTMRRKETERERERYFHYTFYLLMRMVSCYTIYTEKQQSEGRVDCIVETSDYIYIFEFKLDGTADEALQQIEEKGYARPYEADKRKLFKVGTVFSSETGTISDFIFK